MEITGLLEGQSAFELASEYEYEFKKYNKAKILYERAAELGNAAAQFNYGLWFLEGNRPGTKKDLVRARELFEKAAETGMGIAQLNLGQFYEDGKGGVKQDLKRAYKLYKQASKDDSKNWPDNNRYKAFMKLSQMCLEGKGTEQDTAKAMEHMKRAKELREDSIPDGITKLMNLLEQLDPGIRQEKSDKSWRRFSNYVDNLPPGEKPNTYGEWERVLKKFGYEIRSPKPVKKTRKCNFPEFMELCGGDLVEMLDFEMKDAPIPPPSCSLCGKKEEPGFKMKKCARCKEYYCSRECQKKDWKDHKKICDIIADQKL